MSREDPRLGLHARRKLRAHIAGLRLPCGICGGDIDYTDRWHLDEIVPRALGGDPLALENVQPAHVYCNTAAGARIKRIAGTLTADRWPLDHDDW